MAKAAVIAAAKKHGIPDAAVADAFACVFPSKLACLSAHKCMRIVHRLGEFSDPVVYGRFVALLCASGAKVIDLLFIFLLLRLSASLVQFFIYCQVLTVKLLSHLTCTGWSGRHN